MRSVGRAKITSAYPAIVGHLGLVLRVTVKKSTVCWSVALH
jgi:hypothetical protein